MVQVEIETAMCAHCLKQLEEMLEQELEGLRVEERLYTQAKVGHTHTRSPPSHHQRICKTLQMMSTSDAQHDTAALRALL